MRLFLRFQASLLVAVIGCGGGGSAATAPIVPGASIRLLNAISDLGLIDMIWSATGSTPAVGFGETYPTAPGTYATIPAQPALELRNIGGGNILQGRVFTSLVPGPRFLLVALGNASGLASGPLDSLIVYQDTAATPAAGAWVRVINALDYIGSHSFGDSADVYLYPAGSARPGGPTARLAFKARTAYLPYAAGTVTMDVYTTGADPTNPPQYAVQLGLTNGAVRTVILRDPPPASPVGTPGNVFVLADQH